MIQYNRRENSAIKEMALIEDRAATGSRMSAICENCGN